MDWPRGSGGSRTAARVWVRRGPGTPSTPPLNPSNHPFPPLTPVHRPLPLAFLNLPSRFVPLAPPHLPSPPLAPHCTPSPPLPTLSRYDAVAVTLTLTLSLTLSRYDAVAGQLLQGSYVLEATAGEQGASFYLQVKKSGSNPEPYTRA